MNAYPIWAYAHIQDYAKGGEMADYTKGEWKLEIHDENNATIYFPNDAGDVAVFGDNAEANAQRIVDCVNGCEGIENPLAVKDLYEACKETLTHLEILHRAGNLPKADLQVNLEQAIAKMEGKQ